MYLQNNFRLHPACQNLYLNIETSSSLFMHCSCGRAHKTWNGNFLFCQSSFWKPLYIVI